MRNRRVATLLTAFLLIAGAALVGASSACADDVIEWKFQSHHTPGALSTTYVIPPFIERVRERSGGRLNITMYYAGELVDYLEVFPALRPT